MTPPSAGAYVFINKFGNTARSAMATVPGMLGVAMVSVATVVLVITLATHGTSTLSLADTVRLAEDGRVTVPGLPGYRTAGTGVCLSSVAFDAAYVSAVIKEAGHGLSTERPRALIHMLHTAIADTPDGNVFDAGGPPYASTPLILRVLRDLDLCGRRVWSAPGVKPAADDPPPPRDAYRLRSMNGPCNATCAATPVNAVALLRISGDTFSDAAQPLQALYARVQPGGVVLVEDYYASQRVKAAVDAFRTAVGVVEPLSPVEESSLDPARPFVRAAWWQRTHV